MEYNPNKIPAKIIHEGALRGTYFRDIYSSVNGNWYKSDGKNLISWKKFIRSIIAQVDVTYNKYGLKCGTSLRFWENIVCINEIDPYGWFQWYFRYRLSRRSEDDERQINR